MRVRDAKEGMRVKICIPKKEVSKTKYPKRYERYPYWNSDMIKCINKIGTITKIESTDYLNECWHERYNSGVIVVDMPKHGEYYFHACDVKPM